MNSNFNQELMQDFLEKIIQKRKEREMIAATENMIIFAIVRSTWSWQIICAYCHITYAAIRSLIIPSALTISIAEKIS